MHRTMVFDDGMGKLAPLTDLRASFDIRTGALTTLERLTLSLNAQPVALWVPEALTAVTRQGHSLPVNGTLHFDGPTLLYNGRCPVPPEEVASLRPGEMVVEVGSGDLVAANLKPAQIAAALRGARPEGATVRETAGPVLLTRPWHVRRHRDAAIDLDLRLLEKGPPRPATPEQPDEELFEPPEEARPAGMEDAPAPLRLGGSPITVSPLAKVWPGSILDAERGPIVIDARAVVRPGAIIIGPAYVGRCSTVLERATIRGYTSIGPWCKVNGEVGGTIFQGYSNKAHDGYLGDSWVGEWVNLGAGTTNSNLLNTYGEVPAVAVAGGSHERTGETFLGAIIGDHVKTAICTRIMTGAVLHTGGMFAATAPAAGCTPAFCWRTDEGERRYRLERFIEVMKASMARRNVAPSDAYIARIKALHGGG
jgi:UDP-N-acetylglucosamine diphosphorylase/glucosamine-1-phosphate N-acetyltransferase